MKNINNGKDIKELEIHNIDTLGGTYRVIKTLENKSKFINFEPKRNNRWMLKFSDAFEDVPSWSVCKTHRPKLINGSWGDIKIKFHDAIGPSTTQALINGMRINWDKGIKIPIIKYKLLMLGPVGDIIEEWDIVGKVKIADFGDLDYEKSKLTKIKFIIEPIKIILVY